MQDWEGKLTRMARQAHPMPVFVLWTGALLVSQSWGVHASPARSYDLHAALHLQVSGSAPVFLCTCAVEVHLCSTLCSMLLVGRVCSSSCSRNSPAVVPQRCSSAVQRMPWAHHTPCASSLKQILHSPCPATIARSASLRTSERALCMRTCPHQALCAAAGLKDDRKPATSWCPDCNRAVPGVEEAANEAKVRLLKVVVGSKEEYTADDHYLRCAVLLPCCTLH